jgi:formylmethanofuran dehydrogenase subunit E
MSTNQSERLAAESKRQDRRQRASERETHANREQPFQQRSVQMKMRRFHDFFVTLNFSKCLTCSESFPDLQLRSPTMECMRCYRDKHTPKLYSSANGMNPGPLPSQLQVSTCIYTSAFTIPL